MSSYSGNQQKTDRESVLMLSKKLPVVRSIDVANESGFEK